MAQNDTGSFNLVVTFVVILAALFGVWHFFEGPIISGLRWLRLGELHILAIFTARFDAVLQALPHMTVQPHAEKLQPSDLDARTFWNISAAAGDIMRWPAALALVASVLWIQRKSPTAKFKNKYDLEGMIRVQAQSWPTIAPITTFDPSQVSARVPGTAVPTELPLFAESLSPEEWVAWARIPVVENVPDKEGIRQAFIAQLGPRWEGMVGLKPHHRALMAAFALRGAQKRQESDALLGLIAQCWHPRGDGREGGLSLSDAANARINQVMSDRALFNPAMEQANNHAYRTTALIGLLAWSREQGGVLAPAQFLWLRGQDRGLWYALNNLGRRTFHAEGAGAIAHYLAERAAGATAKGTQGRALLMPRVDTAIPPILEFIQEFQKKGGMIPALANGEPTRLPAGRRGSRKQATQAVAGAMAGATNGLGRLLGRKPART